MPQNPAANARAARLHHGPPRSRDRSLPGYVRATPAASGSPWRRGDVHGPAVRTVVPTDERDPSPRSSRSTLVNSSRRLPLARIVAASFRASSTTGTAELFKRAPQLLRIFEVHRLPLMAGDHLLDTFVRVGHGEVLIEAVRGIAEDLGADRESRLPREHQLSHHGGDID
jgi:hypothetical protein